MVDDANITLTSLRIICNYIRDAFGKRNILTEEAVHSLEQVIWRQGKEHMNMRKRSVWKSSTLTSSIYIG